LSAIANHNSIACRAADTKKIYAGTHSGAFPRVLIDIVIRFNSGLILEMTSVSCFCVLPTVSYVYACVSFSCVSL